MDKYLKKTLDCYVSTKRQLPRDALKKSTVKDFEDTCDKDLFQKSCSFGPFFRVHIQWKTYDQVFLPHLKP